MKKVLLLVLALGIVFWGCSESTSLIGPEKAEVQNSFLKVDYNNSTTLMKKKTVNSKLIDGKKGGKLKIDLKMGEVKAKGNLKFKKNSFSGPQNITVDLAFADGEAALEFGPKDLDIDPAALLTVKITGIHFVDEDTAENFGFFYLDEDSNRFEVVDYKKIIINKKHGWIKVVNAELTHFSRYGFAR